MSEASTLSQAAPTADAQRELKTIRVSRASARHNRITADCNLTEVIEQIRTGSGGVRAKIANIRTKARSLRDFIRNGGEANEEELKRRQKELKELKKSLPAVLPSGRFTVRNKNGLSAHSGFICIDVDHLYEKLPEVHAKLCESLYVWALWKSPTGNGLKGLIRVPADAEKHLASFRAVRQHV